jgi:hypothetical protein
MAKKAKVYTGTEWVDLAAATTDLSQYPNMTTTSISGFRNAIINGGFDVWQRGASFAPATHNTYTTDRWWHVNDSVGTTAIYRQDADSSQIPGCQYFLRMYRTAGTARWVLGTNLETSEVKKFKGKTITLSYWLRRGSNITANTSVALKTTAAEGRFSALVEGSTNVVTAANLSTTTFTKFTQTLTIPANSAALGLAVEFEVNSQAGAANAFLDIAMVQLEEGSIATPFERRTIGAELALCQRYYFRKTVSGANTGTLGFGVCTTGTSSFIETIFPVQMRAIPICAVGGSPIVTDSIAYNLSVSGIATQLNNEYAARIQYNHAGTGTVRTPHTLSCLVNGSAFFESSAEL